MRKELTSRVIAESVQDKRGRVAATREYLYQMRFNGKDILYEASEIIKADGREIILSRILSKIKPKVNSKFVTIDLLSGKIF